MSVGTHSQQFNRLLEKIDEIAGKRRDWNFFAQTGHSDYKMKNVECRDFWSGGEYKRIFRNASVIVCHAGAGTIISALETGKKVVVVPRLKRFGEHTNDHQLEIAETLARNKKAIVVEDIRKLGGALKEAMHFKADLSSSREQLVKRINLFLEMVE